MQEQVVIKRPLVGNLLLILGCVAFVAGGIFILQIEEDTFLRLIAIASIVFFGGGGLLFIIVLAWKPIVTISNEGITIPHGWGKNSFSFLKIEKVMRILQEFHDNYKSTLS